jgi:hypothetical protein
LTTVTPARAWRWTMSLHGVADEVLESRLLALAAGARLERLTQSGGSRQAAGVRGQDLVGGSSRRRLLEWRRGSRRQRRES